MKRQRMGPETGSTRMYVRSVAITTFRFVLLAVASAATLPAQDSTRTQPIDSLAERLRRAEEAIAALREQMAAEAASRVQAASRVRVDLFGRVLMNAFSNSARVNNADVPQFALPTGGEQEAGGGTIRQTSFGLSVFVERVLGGRFEGELHTDFYGGQQPSTGGRRFPLLRIRTAHGTVRWQRGELLAGQFDPLVGGLNPVSVQSFGTPEFTAAGNLWLWLPQLRGTWEIWAPAGLALQGAVLAPTSGDAMLPFDTAPDSAELSGRPYLQGRLRVRWGGGGGDGAPGGGRAGEIGVGVHRGWLRRSDGALVTSEMVGADALIPLGRFVVLRGEVYAGRALRGLGGGGVGQGVTATGEPVKDRGGWGQVELHPDTRWSLGAGCGVGDPRADSPLPAGRLKNRTCETHVTLRPDGPVVVSLGWRQQVTTYATGDMRNRHLNAGIGFEF